MQDAFHAVRWLRANAATYNIDTDNIGGIGFSWGCNEVAMLSVIQSTDTFFTVGDVETPAADLVVTAASSNTTKVSLGNIALGGSGANRTAQVTPGANQVGQSTITLMLTDFTIGDVETGTAALTVTASSSNQALLPDTNIVLGGSDASRTVTVTPLPNQIGTSTITLAVSDGVITASDTFTITVTATARQTRWIQHFGTTETSSGPGAFGIDAELDGLTNLLEYAFGGDPSANDAAALLPTAAPSGSNIVFTYPKAAADLVYEPQQTGNLSNPNSWAAVSATEIDNGNVTFSVTVPMSAGNFMRLRVVASSP